MTTIEFYAGPLGIRLVGAVTVGAKSARDNAKAVGKLLCKINHLNELEAVLIGEDGEETDKFMVYR